MRGLLYYPEDVDAYDDMKIMELLEEYGPAGYAVWDVIKKRIYRDGYFLKTDLDKLAFVVVKQIGNKWVKKSFVMQVIDFCAAIGLFDSELCSQGILTSVGIQRRWQRAKAAAKSKAHIEEYNLLGESSAGSDTSRAKTAVNTETIGIDTKTIGVNTVINATKEIKEKKINKYSCYAREAFEEIKKPTDGDLEQLNSLCEKFGEPAVISAISDAIKKGGRSIGYVRAILEGGGVKKNTGRYPPTYDIDEAEKLMDEWSE